MATYTESFNKADSGTLGPDQTWTKPTGDAEVKSNKWSNVTAGSDVHTRCDAAVATDNMYTQAVVNLTSGATNCSVKTRYDTASQSFYQIEVNRGGSYFRIVKCNAGSFTNLGSDQTKTFNAGTDYTLYIEASGSTITAKVDGGSSYSQTDSALTGYKRGGLGSNTGTAGDVTFDSFEVGDLFTAAAAGQAAVSTVAYEADPSIKASAGQGSATAAAQQIAALIKANAAQATTATSTGYQPTVGTWPVAVAGAGAASATVAAHGVTAAVKTNLGQAAAVGEAEDAFPTTDAGALAAARRRHAGTITLSGISSRAEGPRFYLSDLDGNTLGLLHPQRSPTITNGTSGSVKRTISSFTLEPSEASEVNTLTMLVKPVWVIDDIEYPLGVFRWSTATAAVRGYGNWQASQLSDSGIVLKQPIDKTVSFALGRRATECIREIADYLGFFDASIDASSATIDSPLGWSVGRSTWAEILSKLCTIAGFYDWYFTSLGVLTFRRTDDLTSVVPTLTYGSGRNSRIISESISESNDALDAPNVYIAVDNSATAGAVFGTYEIPAELANSRARRRFSLPKLIEIAGLGNEEAARAAAQTAAQTDTLAWSLIEFASAIDPRHETWNPIGFLGSTYLELEWGFPMTHGGAMRHKIKAAFPL